ncbi:putative lipoprotein [Hyphomonas neptunium ATCC 15444]|uniref:Putative lipoprotein n=2 Tax=Hyphomonas TaxID=85 RepID=Q0C2G5_HYPNA|nr:putative lipoprotein [Hyphomonas neptunium ATCC 15444]
MKAGVFAALSALALAGCGLGGPGDRQVMVNACVADGESEATCGCITDAMETNLSPELFEKTAQAVGRDEKDMMTFVGELTLQEQLSFSAVLQDMFACSLTGETAE